MVMMSAIGGHSATAQLVCTDEVYVVRQANGSCCTVTVYTCRGTIGGNFVVQFGDVTPGEGCDDVSHQMPYFLKEVAKQAIIRFAPVPIPECPATSTIPFQTKWSSCYRWHNGVAMPCVQMFCIRTCSVCVVPDPTTCDPSGFSLQFVGCSTSEQACPNQSGNCAVNSCESW